MISLTSDKLLAYSQLMRLEKPIGIYLVAWPMYWALWIAAGGFPRWDLLVIFTLGAIVMRSAGCVINDYADREIDGHVKRTSQRPLPAGRVTEKETLLLFVGLLALAFLLVLLTNQLTIIYSLGGVLLATIYPFMKRYTHLPQVVLGAAFAWAIPMAFTAQSNGVTQQTWLIYVAALLWTVAYDTQYAMVDRDDDLRIGVKSTAVLFGDADRLIVGLLQGAMLITLLLLGQQLQFGIVYYLSLLVSVGFFVYQHWLIRERQRDPCFRAFLNNHWVGGIIFAGIFTDYLLR